MSYFGKNIKKIRIAKKLSQSDFAKIFKLSRASVGSYEEGRAEAKIETLIHISDYFNISIDKLLKTKISINDIFNFENKKVKLENILNKNSIYLVKFDNLGVFFKRELNEDEMEKITIPGFNSDFLAFEYFSDSNKQINNVFDNSILICKKRIIANDIFFSNKLYFVIDKNVYLGKINIKEKCLKIKDFENVEKIIVHNDLTLIYEVEAVFIKNLSNALSLERYSFIERL